jgi:hypothetical protein
LPFSASPSSPAQRLRFLRPHRRYPITSERAASSVDAHRHFRSTVRAESDEAAVSVYVLFPVNASTARLQHPAKFVGFDSNFLRLIFFLPKN